MIKLTRFAALAALALALAPAAAKAGPFQISFGLNGLPSATGPVTALTIPTADLGQQSFTLGSGAGAVNVVVDNQAQSSGGGVVQGSRSGMYAAPVSGPNSTYTDPYLSTGNGTITLSFATPERYLGLLWGSVDYTNGNLGPNKISFYTDGTLVGTVTGDDLKAATNSTAANGSQGYGGSYYTLLNDTAGTFNRVVLTSGAPSFEAAQFQASTGNVSVPEPLSFTLLGTGLVLTGLARRRKRG